MFELGLLGPWAVAGTMEAAARATLMKKAFMDQFLAFGKMKTKN
jgi:hypothetical protein